MHSILLLFRKEPGHNVSLIFHGEFHFGPGNKLVFYYLHTTTFFDIGNFHFPRIHLKCNTILFFQAGGLTTRVRYSIFYTANKKDVIHTALSCVALPAVLGMQFVHLKRCNVRWVHQIRCTCTSLKLQERLLGMQIFAVQCMIWAAALPMLSIVD